jgi:hypothetical protein
MQKRTIKGIDTNNQMPATDNSHLQQVGGNAWSRTPGSNKPFARHEHIHTPEKPPKTAHNHRWLSGDSRSNQRQLLMLRAFWLC